MHSTNICPNATAGDSSHCLVRLDTAWIQTNKKCINRWTLHTQGVTEGSELTQGTIKQSATRSSSTFHPRRLTRIINTVSNKPWGCQYLSTFFKNLNLTFVKASGHVAGRRAQQNPENHCAGHESPSVGWWEETQAGQDYRRQIINALIHTDGIPLHSHCKHALYRTPVSRVITSDCNT